MLVAEPFEFLATQASPDPLVEPEQLPARGEPPGNEVLSGTTDDLIEFHDERGIEVVGTTGQFFDFFAKFLLGLGTHPPGATGEHKPEEGVTLAVGGDPGLLRTQAEPEFGEGALDTSQSLLRLGAGAGEHDEVVGIPDEPEAGGREALIQQVEDDPRPNRAWEDLRADLLDGR